MELTTTEILEMQDWLKNTIPKAVLDNEGTWYWHSLNDKYAIMIEWEGGFDFADSIGTENSYCPCLSLRLKDDHYFSCDWLNPTGEDFPLTGNVTNKEISDLTSFIMDELKSAEGEDSF